MKINIRSPIRQLLRINVMLILTSAVRTVPIGTTAPGLNFDLLANGSDEQEQKKLQLEWIKKETEMTQGGLQVLGDAHDLLSSGVTSLPDTFPTVENLVSDETNSAGVELQEVTEVGEDVGRPGDEVDAELMQVRQRLQKLDFYFEFLRVMSEDCRQRMLCEVMREPGRFYPLSSVLEDAVSSAGTFQYLTSELVNTTEGARLLSYLEAAFRGQDRTRTCAVFQYRCPSRTEDMINYDALCLWREMVRWLTIHVIAKAH
ncbi:hypothetical protein B7P43_G07748 [Cryptotermes secundus]|uniref:Uncharacterized protein n=1 Tax=Cryptotermes secundus TaxID=105785 RepID=A0A2J7QXL2_9NEOP|nr:hypothetical protein B7P43_G07748 [Cryptotermes secundus]